MLGSPPPASGPTVDTVQRQKNQLLAQPGGTTGLPQRNQPTGASIFPGIGGALSQSPLLQQSNNQINQMVAALMQTGRRM